MKRPITIDFFEESVTVNNASNCQLLRQNPSFLMTLALHTLLQYQFFRVNVVQNSFRQYL